MISTGHHSFGSPILHQEPDAGLAYRCLNGASGVLTSTPSLEAEAGTVSTHPEELKAEDRNDMARGSGPEWGLVTLEKFSQVDVGQGSTDCGIRGKTQDLHISRRPETTVNISGSVGGGSVVRREKSA